MSEKSNSGKSIQRRSSISDWGVKINTVNEYLDAALKAVKKGSSFTKALEDATPWLEGLGKAAEYVGDVIRPIKLIAKVINDITKITDPEKLGYIACTIAFQNALRLAIEDVTPHNEPSFAVDRVKEQLQEINFEDLDFSLLDKSFPIKHDFFPLALYNAEAALMLAGYSEEQRGKIQIKVQDLFGESLRLLLSHGDTAEKLKPFTAYLGLGRDEQIARKSLSRHANYQVWQFESAPVLGKEPFALKDVYIESECGSLTWGEIIRQTDESPERVVRNEMKPPKLDAFDEENGGRHGLLEVVMKLLADEKNKQPIIIQGVAGSGKTSFTLRLCSELDKHGLIPIRVRLRDVNLGWNFDEALPRAIRLSDIQYAEKNALFNYEIFHEGGVGNFSKISRYVLILDGWDELSTSANESFKERVDKIVRAVLDKFIRYSSFKYPVKIILTGRPSEQITNSELLNSETPVLTLRSLTNEQLARFVDNIQQAARTENIEAFREKFEAFPADYFPKDAKPDFEDWENFDKSKFDSILSRYNHKEKRLEVLGLPLLAHLTAHLLKPREDENETESAVDEAKNAVELVENETSLYRNLINLTCEKAGKAYNDPGILPEDARRFPTFRGEDLRKLLWATAVAMSVFGDETISYDELERRLKENEELRVIVEKVSKENWLSSLLISFYFKGGVKELGCEFSHKSFRQYLFAEAVVNELKEFGRQTTKHFDERENEWEDFPSTDRDDQRFTLSRNLARLLSPRWLMNEVVDFLRELIRWEIERARDKKADKDVVKYDDALTLEQWQFIRDALADIWGWWNDSVHLRPQAEYRKGRYVYEKPAFVNELIQNAMPFSEEREVPPPPANALDAHLGEALCYLNVFLHAFVRGRDKNIETHRKHQSIIDGEKRFKPSADSRTVYTDWFLDFYNVCGRINNIGDRPRSIFPGQMELFAVELSKCYMDGLFFIDAKLDDANLDYVSLDHANLYGASLYRASLQHADFHNVTLNLANLNTANFYNVNFNNANLDYANLYNANFNNADFGKVDLLYTHHLTKEQISSAFIDNFTRLPSHLEHLKDHLVHLSIERQQRIGDSVDSVNVD